MVEAPPTTTGSVWAIVGLVCSGTVWCAKLTAAKGLFSSGPSKPPRPIRQANDTFTVVTLTTGASPGG